MPSFFDKLRGKQGSGGSGGKLKSSSMGSLYKDYGGGNIGGTDNERSVDGGGGYDQEELNRSSAMASSFPQSSTSLFPKKSDEKIL